VINVRRVVTSPRLGQQFIRRRMADGSYVNEGEWQDGEPQDLAAFGVVAPPTNSQLQLLPAGERANEIITVYTETNIRHGNGETTKSDIIKWRGGLYEVKWGGPWESYGYFLGVCVRIGSEE
jgi:hypothetical protein